MDAAKALGMRFILMKQEVAGAMLSAWGEITGRPGVCLSTRGPGATNMVNGIAHAFLDRAPMIAITDRYSNPEQQIGLRQRLDQQAIMQPLVKWSTAIDATTVKQQLRRAIRMATAPPWPSAFDLPQSETQNRRNASQFAGAYAKLLSSSARPTGTRDCRNDDQGGRKTRAAGWAGVLG